jgi:glycosyltransferase involved in cell wall biosynthesis
MDNTPGNSLADSPRVTVKVSVIICAYTIERLKDIHEAIDSVITQTLKPYELIVAVDHNNELFKRLKAELPSGVKVILNEGAQGLSETRNVGIRVATGEITAFMDDDALAGKIWLYKLTQHFKNPEVMAVGGRAIPLWLIGKRPNWFPEELDWIVGCTYKGLPLDGNRIRNVLGCNMAFRKDVFDLVGFFSSDIGGVNETPRGGEEADLCLRIKHKMSEAIILYEPNAIIHHRVTSRRLNLKYLAKRCYNEGFYKRMVEKLAPKLLKKSLSTEESYLRYLIFHAIPARLRHFYIRNSLPQVGAIIFSIVATGVGYLVGKTGQNK